MRQRYIPAQARTYESNHASVGDLTEADAAFLGVLLCQSLFFYCCRFFCIPKGPFPQRLWLDNWMDIDCYLDGGLGNVELSSKTTLPGLVVIGSGLLLCEHDEVSHSYHTFCVHDRHACLSGVISLIVERFDPRWILMRSEAILRSSYGRCDDWIP